MTEDNENEQSNEALGGVRHLATYPRKQTTNCAKGQLFSLKLLRNLSVVFLFWPYL